MPTRQGGSFWKKVRTWRRFNWRRMTTWPAASTPCTWKTDFAMSRPIVVIVCMDAPPNRGSLNSAHIHGTHVPVEEPSTASVPDSCSAAKQQRTCTGFDDLLDHLV